jgi:toxin ParE1/3/4
VRIEHDLPEIYAFIAKDDPVAADRVLDAVDATFSQLTQQPGSGVIYPTRSPALQDVRLLPVHGFHNYLVFYRIEGDAVRVLYVVPGARHLPRLFRRERRA